MKENRRVENEVHINVLGDIGSSIWKVYIYVYIFFSLNLYSGHIFREESNEKHQVIYFNILIKTVHTRVDLHFLKPDNDKK